MSRTLSPDKNKLGVELFSDMMVMKFKPQNTLASKKAKESPHIRKRLITE
jgi:hypothetical protein